jgi:hypothetical protein
MAEVPTGSLGLGLSLSALVAVGAYVVLSGPAPGANAQGKPGSVRPLTADDRLDIQDLISQHSITTDTGDIDGWVTTYAKDGNFEGQRRGNAVRGHEALRQFSVDRLKRPDLANASHWNGNVLITPTAEGARAKSYEMTIERLADGTYRVLSVSIKNDELIREDGHWRFKSRVNTPWPVAAPKASPGQ